MNEHQLVLTLHGLERRMRALEGKAGVTPDLKDVVQLPNVRKFKSDAISQDELNKKEAELEAYWKGENKRFMDQATANMNAEADRRAEEMRATVAIAVAAALKDAGLTPSAAGSSAPASDAAKTKAPNK
jgi:hypothetical protein